MTHTKTYPAVSLFAMMIAAVTLICSPNSASSRSPYPSDPGVCKIGIDVPMNYRGKEMICLYNLERLLDAKQEWARDNRAGRGALVPSAESLADRYFRIYKYGRRFPCDDETQKKDVFRPICPSGGQYVVGAVGERPKCTYHGDSLRDYDQHIRVPHTH